MPGHLPGVVLLTATPAAGAGAAGAAAVWFGHGHQVWNQAAEADRAVVVVDPALSGQPLRTALARLQPILPASRRGSIRLHRPDPGPVLSAAEAQQLAEQHPGTELLAGHAEVWRSFPAGGPAAAAAAPPRLPDLAPLGDTPLDLGVGVTAVPGHLPGVVLLTATPAAGAAAVWFGHGHQVWNQAAEADRAVVVVDPALSGQPLRTALARLQPTLPASRRGSIRLHRPDPGPVLSAAEAQQLAEQHPGTELLAGHAQAGSFLRRPAAAAAAAPPRLPDLAPLGDTPLDLGVGVTAVPGHLPGVVLLTATPAAGAGAAGAAGAAAVWFGHGHQVWNQAAEADRAVVVVDPALSGQPLRTALARLQPTLPASRRSSIRLHRPGPGPVLSDAEVQQLAEQHPGSEVLAGHAQAWQRFSAGQAATPASAPPRPEALPDGRASYHVGLAAAAGLVWGRLLGPGRAVLLLVSRARYARLRDDRVLDTVPARPGVYRVLVDTTPPGPGVSVELWDGGRAALGPADLARLLTDPHAARPADHELQLITDGEPLSQEFIDRLSAELSAAEARSVQVTQTTLPSADVRPAEGEAPGVGSDGGDDRSAAAGGDVGSAGDVASSTPDVSVEGLAAAGWVAVGKVLAAGVVQEWYPWLGSVNPWRGIGGDFVTNCVLAAIALDMSLRDGVGYQAPPEEASAVAWLANYAGRGLVDVAGWAAVAKFMAQAPAGSRGFVVFGDGTKQHVVNVVHDQRRGVLFLDGEHGRQAWAPPVVGRMRFVATTDAVTPAALKAPVVVADGQDVAGAVGLRPQQTVTEDGIELDALTGAPTSTGPADAFPGRQPRRRS